ncbi:C40 family peptidase [Corynebacterium halotolerans]|uniref:NPL/P60 family protein n=1 Tax=Corynebacterium halotolerans YIM 70093 = DSM 44683 TaxID=1121362 RepID=M1NTX4_9CORY|nr:C40 family peptidase [Corynebacterium halotolerans]AGF72922.1 NPL/P60 family protein [Corynebacterium halotolerans YIM 70093 = DSM 44683]
MAKHRRQGLTTRRIAAASAVAVGATVLTPGVAGAVEVAIPNTDIRVEVPGLENVPGYQEVAPALQGLSSQATTYTADVQVPNAAAAPAPAPAVAPASSSTGQAIVDAARSKIGSPYGWGATGPNAFDCSGLTSWAYQQVGKSIPRTSQAQAAQGTPVSLGNMQPGDIISYYGGASHVAIYAGNGMMIDALNSGSTVQERPINYMPINSVVRF